jgi:hypothetical protein
MNAMYTYHVLIFMWYYPNGLNLGHKKTWHEMYNKHIYYVTLVRLAQKSFGKGELAPTLVHVTSLNKAI